MGGGKISSLTIINYGKMCVCIYIYVYVCNTNGIVRFTGGCNTSFKDVPLMRIFVFQRKFPSGLIKSENRFSELLCI